MAIAAPITPVAVFQTALSAYDATALMRQVALTDDDRTSVETLVEPFYVRMVEAPAGDLTDVKMKLAAIMAEAGAGLVEVEDIAFVARDIEALLCLSH